ncbi:MULTISPECIES: NAD(P)-dependent oxidoreductase [unclassified Pseudomonas]|uniref:NAD-dependent epimerase/dehydratase family protein n=1 Tax=unclassified Pseudomonas TaxID=196821 RepID=UPI000BCD1742|nr:MULTISPECIES: NAD(P)-dependent oxidoreductase [unclassified Pseudomonas]PVZ13733.1 dTDP-6-deoxy-L-talose 4-dehydrogenase (NAD+) [Pseudomonas sp. URIL14HWK12:I12]PVZ24039.1 dTDP-6-deoxy-L-talose 4-dehydrogenase (NAD+) [Pseudomonas sp. URIL14HWK12:I10]PVZ33322.1 dTDP-6-deoxy-L-talose 4-dehydrogenase (NAD+) [Pseudomonas sp. URIL14HWK12:I11]SNZ11145.1 dTDP-6-deoxy-L-talose 4-dehydrogenase (NAD+) [Pseudomonas sp. URIL14HWK12:I9]
MKLLVTGGTGFIGQHLLRALLAAGHTVRALARDVASARALPGFAQVQWVQADLDDPSLDVGSLAEGVEQLVHLAWQNLPNYQAAFHYEHNLFAHYRFIKAVVQAGVERVAVTGTCFEYGLHDGALSESMPAQPVTAYGLAKYSLLGFLQALQRQQPFTLQWWRLFYLHGQGQNPNSLLASLDRAIDAGEHQFCMSPGDQLRDYLPVAEAAGYLARLLAVPGDHGVINCCSGRPTSLRALVEQRLLERGASLELVLGHYPYAAHEPLAFWGNPTRLRALLKEPVDG